MGAICLCQKYLILVSLLLISCAGNIPVQVDIATTNCRYFQAVPTTERAVPARPMTVKLSQVIDKLKANGVPGNCLDGCTYLINQIGSYHGNYAVQSDSHIGYCCVIAGRWWYISYNPYFIETASTFPALIERLFEVGMKRPHLVKLRSPPAGQVTLGKK